MAATGDDIYRMLGLEEGAEPEEVKRAYRLWAAELHSDTREGDPEAVLRVAHLNETYFRWLDARGEAPPADTSLPFALDPFEDLFADIFGAGTNRPRRGSDLRMPLVISAGDALAGIQREVVVTRHLRCNTCSGSGSRDGVLTACAGCAGTGKAQQQAGAFVIHTTCADCGGRGKRATDPCRACTEGLIAREETVKVTVPAGVESGQLLRLPGRGNECFEGESGHLFLSIEIEPEPLAREGADAIVEVTASSRHVLFGGSIQALAPDGRVAVDIPRGVRDRHTIRIAGRGHPRASETGATAGRDPYRGSAGNGDLVVIVRVPPETAALPRQMLVTGIAIATIAAAALWLSGR